MVDYHWYVESKIWHKWTYLWNRNRLKHREQTCGCQGWGAGGEGKSRNLGLADANCYGGLDFVGRQLSMVLWHFCISDEYNTDFPLF